MWIRASIIFLFFKELDDVLAPDLDSGSWPRAPSMSELLGSKMITLSVEYKVNQQSIIKI